MKASLPANNLARVLRNAALFKGERPILKQCQIMFREKRLEIRTTDSYALLVEFVDAEVPDEMIGTEARITLTEIKELLAIAKGVNAPVTIEVIEDRTEIQCSNGAIFKWYSAGSWPNTEYVYKWREFDGIQATGTLGIGLWQLARLAKLEPSTYSKSDKTVAGRFQITDNLKPFIVTIKPDITVLLMPVKLS